MPVGFAVGPGGLDVANVDTSTLMMGRADGVGGMVAPLNWFHTEDVGTPFYGDWCDCHEWDGDGFMDLKLRFYRPDVTEALLLDGMAGGTCVELVMYGQFLDGTAFVATDNITLVPIGDGGGGEAGTTAPPAFDL